MKINISGLMNLIAEDERKFNYLSNSLRNKVYSVSIQELNGTVNVIVALKLDRLTRSVYDVEKLMKLLETRLH